MSLRFVTAASLFDGHDASINIIRRLLQAHGVEVIHLGHNRSVKEVVDAVVCEDADAVAISSYQGGHNEYFQYLKESLNGAGLDDVCIFGGGGGVITLKEISALEAKGISKIYHPSDGMKIGLEGIIKDMIERTQVRHKNKIDFAKFKNSNLNHTQLAKVITHIENIGEIPFQIKTKNIPVLGVTGTGGAGKSSLIDELLLRFNLYFTAKKIALVSVDPSKKSTKGALLGDRIRIGSASVDNFFIRSLATRNSQHELSPQIEKVVEFLKSQDFDLIMVETSGIGQSSDAITKVADKSIYVMTPEYGAQTQLEKIEMLEVADFIVLNKFEKPRSEDAIRDIRKQVRRNKKLFDLSIKDEELPVYGTRASKFNDTGVNALFFDIIKNLNWNLNTIETLVKEKIPQNKFAIIAANRVTYLRDIAETIRNYNLETKENFLKLDHYESLVKASNIVKNTDLENAKLEYKNKIKPEVLENIKLFDETINHYKTGEYNYIVRGKNVSVKSQYISLSGQVISKVSFPELNTLAEKYKFMRNENLPGFFPYAVGIFPFKRADEDPKRMFAGEGGPKRTNKRFHYLSKNDEFKRLSTAFDSVTLYGQDPDKRPDIYGKVGESGVSIATLDDMEALFQGFDLVNPKTSVSMTINGPAPIILAMYMNAALNQKLKGAERENLEKQIEVMREVRGTVQADILKEDQAQNTCIFSLEFSLKLMGDIQEYFSKFKIKNYYSVSISGYHIAEAGANPISQLAFTLSNGFTYVEYYLSRGLKIDDFSQNLSFFFSNGLDPEYTVIGRVARKIWSVAMKYKYGANEASQKLKYHIQTSGRSLHAQEIDFNDIRTTLQAFLALSDNCNSLHTNAYDEAITTPTEESVRRAMAIQLIINREFGMNKTDNPLQGSFLINELTQIVEDAVLKEFENISDKGGVLGAMESMYQRGKIQEESLYYEQLKDSGALPLIGVNTYLSEDTLAKMNEDIQLTRSTDDEKNDQINRLNSFKDRNKNFSQKKLEELKLVALNNGNVFEKLLDCVRYCSLGEITSLLYEIGGKYRRNM